MNHLFVRYLVGSLVCVYNEELIAHNNLDDEGPYCHHCRRPPYILQLVLVCMYEMGPTVS